MRYRSLKGHWAPAIVRGPVDGVPRSYELHTDQQNVLRHNRKHIFPTKECVTLQPPPRKFDPAITCIPDSQNSAQNFNLPIESPTESIPKSPYSAQSLPEPATQSAQTSRSGRLIKKPVKLDL